MNYLQILSNTPPFFSCEYWKSVIQNSFGCAIGSFFAIIISLLIYLDSLKKSANEKANAKLDEEAKQLKAFSLLLKNGIDMAKKQEQNINKFIEELSSNITPNDLPLMGFVPLNNLKRIIDSITVEVTGLAYMNYFSSNKNAAKDFTEILSYVDYLHLEFNYLPEVMKRTIDYDYERKKEMQKTFAESYEALANFMLNQNLQEQIPKNIHNIVSNFRIKLKSREDLKSYNELFFVPLNQYMANELANYPNNFFAFLAQKTRNGRDIFEDMKSENERSIQGLTQILTNVHRGIESLEKYSTALFSSNLSILS